MKSITSKTQVALRAAVCLGVIFSLQVNAADISHSRLDASLSPAIYQLPEDSNRPEPTQDELFFGMKKMLHALDSYFSADVQAMDKVPTNLDDPNPPSDLVKWRISALITEIAISVKGLIAPLALKGTAGLKVILKKKQPAQPVDYTPMDAAQHNESIDNVPGIRISDSTTRDEVMQQLEPLISMVVKTKKVESEQTFRDSIYEEASQFYSLSQVLADDPGTPWWVSRFRLDLWIMASGKVQPNVNVGGEFKLRFEWFRLKPTSRGMRPQLASNPSPREKDFREFVEAMSYDAQKVSYDAFQETGFYPNYLKIGIGMNAQGSFGIVKFGGGIAGYLYLSTVAKEPTDWNANLPEPKSVEKPVLVIERNPPESHLVYAQQHNIPFDVVETQSGRGIIKDIIYKLDRVRFRAGLVRATNMASRMAERAREKGEGRKWRIHEIRPSFELSIGGEFKLVSINGFANLEMSLYNGNF